MEGELGPGWRGAAPSSISSASTHSLPALVRHHARLKSTEHQQSIDSYSRTQHTYDSHVTIQDPIDSAQIEWRWFQAKRVVRGVALQGADFRSGRLGMDPPQGGARPPPAATRISWPFTS